MRAGQHEQGRFKRAGKNGREVGVRASFNPLIGQDGKPWKVVKLASEITPIILEARAFDSVVHESQDVIQAALRGAGDLTSRVTVDGKSGHFKALAESVNSMIQSMMEVVDGLSKTSHEVHLGAEEISRGNLELSRRTEEQAASLEETASSMEQMTSTVKNNADNAAHASQLAEAAREQAERGGRVATLMDATTQQNAALAEEDTAAARALSALASSLTQLIAHFRHSDSRASSHSSETRAKSAAHHPAAAAARGLGPAAACVTRTRRTAAGRSPAIPDHSPNIA